MVAINSITTQKGYNPGARQTTASLWMDGRCHIMRLGIKWFLALLSCSLFCNSLAQSQEYPFSTAPLHRLSTPLMNRNLSFIICSAQPVIHGWWLGVSVIPSFSGFVSQEGISGQTTALHSRRRLLIPSTSDQSTICTMDRTCLEFNDLAVLPLPHCHLASHDEGIRKGSAFSLRSDSKYCFINNFFI